MTTGVFLATAMNALHAAGIPSARLDCLVLLEDMLSRDRAYILAHPEAEIPKPTEIKLNKKIAQRATHLPLAYIRGIAPFYGRDFIVNQSVLIPRPETETVIDILKNLPLPDNAKIADIGTGSGCLGITAVLEIPDSSVGLYDVNQDALSVAEKNAAKYAIGAQCHQSNLLENYHGPHDAILANLPYVPQDYAVNEAARHEPPIALYSGADGLNHYRRFWRQIAALPQDKKPTFVLTEALRFQHAALAELAQQAEYRIGLSEGLIQQFQR